MSDHPKHRIGNPSGSALLPIGVREAKPIPLSRPFILIGSRNRAHLHLVSKAISRNHACLIRSEHNYYLRDLASRTGVVVNGRRVKETDLQDGDSVDFGNFRFWYMCPAKSADTSPVTEKTVSAVLGIDAGPSTPLDARTVLIGRCSKSDISLTDTAVSKSHALIFHLDGRHYVRDLGSRTGTLLNGKPVRQQVLEFGDEIKIGDTIFRYQPLVAELPEAPEPGEEPVAVQAPPEWKVTAVVADQPQAAQEPLPWIDAKGRTAEVGFGVFSPLREPKALVDRDAEHQPEPKESEDDSGLVPLRGANGGPIYVKMQVPNSYAWFPAMAEIVGQTAGQKHQTH
jgi:pSer/pThr/pTyr-binding forkhead associated (FHA) protein